MKTITVAGERLTEADQRVLEAVAKRAAIDRAYEPVQGQHAKCARLTERGLLSNPVTGYYLLTLHGKGVAAALAASKREVAGG